MSRCTPKYWFRRAHRENFRSVHFCLFRQHRPISSVAVIHQFGSDWRDSGHRADIVDRSKMTQIQLGVSYFEQPGSQGQMLQHAVSATVSLLRISAVSSLERWWIRVSVSVRSAGPPSGCQRVERGNRELVPHGRVIYARNRSRQRRSQEMSVRALRRVAHQDGLARLKTLYAACVR